MSEYVERNKVIELLRTIPEVSRSAKSSVEAYQNMAERCVMIMPSDNVAPVVCCKDCKWYGHDKLKGGFCRKPEASMWSPGLPYDELKPDDYCSRAKRKEDENG